MAFSMSLFIAVAMLAVPLPATQLGSAAGFGVTYSYSLYYSVVGSLNKGAALRPIVNHITKTG